MSDNYLRFIPVEPTYAPTATAAEEARLLLATLVPDADEVTATISDEIEFVDQGANFERVSCPRCGTKLEDDWWGDAVEVASAGNFTRLEVTVPCCDSTLSLNDLDYDWPAGFAKFVLEAMNPNVRDLEEGDIHRPMAVLGTPLRRIWAHY
jgi:hypothetical protein